MLSTVIRNSTNAEPNHPSMIAWEAIMSLERLHRAASIHREPARERRRILRAARRAGERAVVRLGSAPRAGRGGFPGRTAPVILGLRQLATILNDRARLAESGYVMLNDVRETSWGVRFPRILTLLAVPVAARNRSGWMLALNKRSIRDDDSSKPASRVPSTPAPDEAGSATPPIVPFRRRDTALLMPFASLLGFHAQSYQRYQHIKELLVGLTRSLTAAIDAKDAYTYGHSERVARAAVELGRALGSSEDELSDIYLAGLLHDIGKIGIRDDVLTKRGPLSPEELQHIQQHVVIGHGILADLHAIDHLLPGVLYHHERYDGGGYPEGLKGEAIPMLPRILAVADSFDAMNTSRPYRVAMAPERIDEVLREGAGIQWDPLVIDAYFRCRDRLAAIRQRGLGESLRNALEGALRHGTRALDFASIEQSIIHPI